MKTFIQMISLPKTPINEELCKKIDQSIKQEKKEEQLGTKTFAFYLYLWYMIAIVFNNVILFQHLKWITDWVYLRSDITRSAQIIQLDT